MRRPRTLRESWPGLRRIVTHFGPLIHRQRVLIAGSLCALFVEVGLRTLEPLPLKFVLDRVLDVKHAKGRLAFAFLEGQSSTTLIMMAALAFVAITGLRALASYANTVGLSLAGNRVLSEVRARVYRHLQGLSLSFHHKARSGDLVLRVMSDVNMLKDVTVTAALPLLANLLLVVAMIAMMFWLHWQLALVAMALLPLFWLWTARFSRRIQKAARSQRKRESAMAATASEAMSAIKTVQALSLEAVFADSFLSRNNESQKEDVKSARLTAGLGRSVGFLTAASYALVLWYGARLVLSHELTPGELLMFLAYMKNAFRSIEDFARYTGRLAKASAAGERVIDLLENTPEVCDLPSARPAPAFEGKVRFEGVSFAYEPGRFVLDHVDFEASPGQHIAIVGSSGIGKSTLVSLLLRFYDPAQGTVRIDGRDIREYTLASLRAQICVVLQDTLLFAASVRDNIAYGSPQASPEAIEAAARLANAHDFIESLPQGYETVLGERGVTLSGGQRQRIAIARAAVRRAPILILDEPATALDEENQRIILEAIQRLARDRTTFCITHDLLLAARADQILFLEKGRVLERGTHAALLQFNGRYAALFRLQTSGQNAFESPTFANGAFEVSRI
jgi:ATP-binding cassette subfamily B protein